MRVAVTGASGFVGSHLVPALGGRGWELVPLAHRSPTQDPNGGTVDVRNPTAVASAIKGCDAVVHLAAILRGRPGDMEAVNVGGTANVVEACRGTRGQRLLQVSAQGADRRSPSAFLRSKAQGEEVVRASGLRWTILRPSLVLGPGSGFGERMAPLLHRRRIPLVGSGQTLVQPIHVDDLVQLIALCLGGGRAEGQVLEVGGPERVSLEGLMRRFAEASGRGFRPVHIPLPMARMAAALMGRVMDQPPVTADEVTMMTMDNVCDDTGIRALGFTPRLGLDAMVADSLVP